MAIKLKDGTVLTDEEIERECEGYESGSWEGRLTDVRVGRPPLSSEANANLSFKCPASGAELIALAARIEGVGKSAFIRAAALEKAAHVVDEARIREAVSA